MRSTQAGAGRIRAAHHGTEHGLSEPAASAVEAPRLSRLRHAAVARDAGVSAGLSFYSLLLLRTISGDGDGSRAMGAFGGLSRARREAHRVALRDSEQWCPLRAHGIHDCPDVVHAVFKLGDASNTVRQPGTPLVERDQTREIG